MLCMAITSSQFDRILFYDFTDSRFIPNKKSQYFFVITWVYYIFLKYISAITGHRPVGQHQNWYSITGRTAFGQMGQANFR